MSDLKVELSCMTCAFTTWDGTIEQRDAAHLRHDGAHEAGWYTEAFDATLIRYDREIAQLAATGEITDYDARPVDALWCVEVIYSGRDGETDYAYGYVADADEPEARWLMPYGCTLLESTVKPTPQNPAWVRDCECAAGEICAHYED